VRLRRWATDVELGRAGLRSYDDAQRLCLLLS